MLSVASWINSFMAHDKNGSGTEGNDIVQGFRDRQALEKYSRLFSLLWASPVCVAALCQAVRMSEIDYLLQTIMFDLYGTGTDERAEQQLMSVCTSVLSAQFSSASDFSSLLRANTVASRMIIAYTRRPASQAYLLFVLAPQITKLIDQDGADLEINTAKVRDQLSRQPGHTSEQRASGETSTSPSDAADMNISDEDVQALVAARVERLQGIAARFLSAIIDGKHRVPHGVRRICQQIRIMSRHRYPEMTGDAVTSLVGSFFFLRFINPAIVTPQAFQLIQGVPPKHSRRTLTLVAKMLQTLVDKPSYVKEPYMEPLHPFIAKNRSRMAAFLTHLSDVEDLPPLSSDATPSCPPEAINISRNEIYNTHRLALKYIDDLNPHCTAKLRSLLEELGEAPAALARVDDQMISLRLSTSF